ncbi:MAG: metallophosphoesterase [Oligoflexales bacterium]
MIVFLLSIILILTSCSDFKDKRSNIDQNIGNIETRDFLFSTENGILNIVSADQNSLEARAGSPEFSAAVLNKSAEIMEFQFTISNILSDLGIKVDDTVINELEQLQGKKTWQVSIPVNSTIKIETLEHPAESFEFLAFGDIQNGIENFDEVITVLNQQENIDFILFLGDLTMNSDVEEFKKIEEAFAKISFPIYSTPGNHDVRSANRYHNYFGKSSYSWDYKGTRFTSIDSASWTLSKSSWELYKTWLQQAKNQTHIVFSHIAPTEPFGLRGGHWRSRREANAFIAESSRAGVDAMFYGHLHTLDIYSLAGIPVYISGGGGAFQEYFDGIERHFLKVNVHPSNSQIGVNIVRVD